MAYQLTTQISGAKTPLHFQISVATGATSAWYVIPFAAENITVEVIPAGGASGYIQTTNDNAGAIAGTATGVTWFPGTVSAAAVYETTGSVAAIRLVSVSGAVVANVIIRA